ncbi:hypothetical protein C8R47DRAFT_1219226 [Mycena vitilis]|nr:hypothetical protein C8R47DRAFT_1219226 [Mycena vitilis]
MLVDVQDPYVAALGDSIFFEDEVWRTPNKTRERPGHSSTKGAAPIMEHLLTSNDAPKAAETAAIQHTMRARHATVARLKAQISEVHSVVRAMQAKRNALVKEEHALLDELHRYRGVLSPVRRLPPEILGEIFLYFAPALKSDHGLSRQQYRCTDLGRARIPWRLGHISRFWRSIALSVRSLWSVFDLRPHHRLWYMDHDDPDSPDKEICPWEDLADDTMRKSLSIQRRLAAVENRLERSTQTVSGRIVYRDEPLARLFLNALCESTRRLSHIGLVDFPQNLLDQFFQSTAQYDQLRSLALVFTRIKPSIIFQSPTHLTTLTLRSITISPATQASIRWAQLTKYCETDCVWEDAEGRWVSYRQLVDVIDFCVQFPPEVDGPDDIVLMPKLQSARLSYRGGELMPKAFEFPALQSLSYTHEEARSVVYCHHFQLPGTSSSLQTLPHLKVLRLRVGVESATLVGLGDALVRAPELKEVFIDLENFSDLEFPTGRRRDLVKLLTAGEDRLPLCPKLEVLQLGKCNSRTDAIREMIQSRSQVCAGVARLRQVTLYDIYSPRADEMIEIAKEFAEEGLDISIVQCNFMKGHFCDSS